jgi:hypothetical protein
MIAPDTSIIRQPGGRIDPFFTNSPPGRLPHRPKVADVSRPNASGTLIRHPASFADRSSTLSISESFVRHSDDEKIAPTSLAQTWRGGRRITCGVIAGCPIHQLRG